MTFLQNTNEPHLLKSTPLWLFSRPEMKHLCDFSLFTQICTMMTFLQNKVEAPLWLFSFFRSKATEAIFRVKKCSNPTDCMRLIICWKYFQIMSTWVNLLVMRGWGCWVNVAPRYICFGISQWILMDRVFFPEWTFSETPLKFCRNFRIRHPLPNIFIGCGLNRFQLSTRLRQSVYT